MLRKTYLKGGFLKVNISLPLVVMMKNHQNYLETTKNAARDKTWISFSLAESIPTNYLNKMLK